MMQLLTVKEVAKTLGMSVPTVWRRARSDEHFPKPIHIGENATRWLASEVQAFIADCAARRDVVGGTAGGTSPECKPAA